MSARALGAVRAGDAGSLAARAAFLPRAVAGAAGVAAALAWGAVDSVRGREPHTFALRFTRIFHRLVCPALNISVDIRGGEILDAARPCVFVANHQSYIDYPILSALFPRDTTVVGKRELGRYPVVGWLYRRAGQVLIDRDRPRAARETLDAVTEAVRTRGISAFVFPEGTRASRRGELLPFKRGAFDVAIRAGVPVVPIVVAPLKPRTELRRGRLLPHRVRIVVDEPIATTGLTVDDARDLAARVRQRMQQTLDSLA